MDSKHSQTTPATTSTSSIRQLLGAANAQTAHPATSSTAPAHQTTGLRERGNDTSKSTGRSGRQKAATRRNMRREERVTVQGPVKKQQPGGMSHGGLLKGVGTAPLDSDSMCGGRRRAPSSPPESTSTRGHVHRKPKSYLTSTMASAGRDTAASTDRLAQHKPQARKPRWNARSAGSARPKTTTGRAPTPTFDWSNESLQVQAERGAGPGGGGGGREMGEGPRRDGRGLLFLGMESPGLPPAVDPQPPTPNRQPPTPNCRWSTANRRRPTADGQPLTPPPPKAPPPRTPTVNNEERSTRAPPPPGTFLGLRNTEAHDTPPPPCPPPIVPPPLVLW